MHINNIVNLCLLLKELITKAKPKKMKGKKKWEVFPGKNTFFCDGRLIMGRQVRLVLALSLVLRESGENELFITLVSNVL